MIGASSSRRLGWLRKLSLEATQSCLISASFSWTCLVVLPFLAPTSLLMISSSKFSSIQKKTLKKRNPFSQTNPENKRFYLFGEWVSFVSFGFAGVQSAGVYRRFSERKGGKGTLWKESFYNPFFSYKESMLLARA